MTAKKVVLKPGKEKAILNRHHWIFSGAIAEAPGQTDGEILPVYSCKGELLGSGYFNSKAKIFGRMLSLGSERPLEALQKHLESALDLRVRFFENQQTTAYRLVNGEGDFLLRPDCRSI